MGERVGDKAAYHLVTGELFGWSVRQAKSQIAASRHHFWLARYAIERGNHRETRRNAVWK
jgi:hypothetical protein